MRLGGRLVLRGSEEGRGDSDFGLAEGGGLLLGLEVGETGRAGRRRGKEKLSEDMGRKWELEFWFAERWVSGRGIIGDDFRRYFDDYVNPNPNTYSLSSSFDCSSSTDGELTTLSTSSASFLDFVAARSAGADFLFLAVVVIII